MIFPTQTYEHHLRSQGYKFIAGVDEAGRGAWAGPLVAAAVIMPANGKIIAGARDSKLLKEKKREEIFFEIKKTALSWSVGIIDIEYINQYNIGRANVKAFEMAINGLDMEPDYALIDGVCWKKKHYRSNQSRSVIPTEVEESLGYARDDKNIGYARDDKPLGGYLFGQAGIQNDALFRRPATREYIKDGDAKIYSIAAASIIAKVTRDNILKEMHIKYPAYGFDKHKGYGTKGHSDALLKYGICAEHRILYKPIKRIMKRES